MCGRGADSADMGASRAVGGVAPNPGVPVVADAVTVRTDELPFIILAEDDGLVVDVGLCVACLPEGVAGCAGAADEAGERAGVRLGGGIW